MGKLELFWQLSSDFLSLYLDDMVQNTEAILNFKLQKQTFFL